MDYKWLLILVLGAAIYLLWDVLVIMFIAFLLTAALLPIVRWLKIRKVPRVVSAVLLVIGLFVIPLILLASVGPTIIEQGKELSINTPQLVEQLETRLDMDLSQEIQDRFTNNSGQLAAGIFSVTSSVLKLVASLILVLVITVYWLIYYDSANAAIIKLLATSKRRERQITKTITSLENRLGSWVKAQILISLAVGLLTWLVLALIGVPYAGVLAVIAGLLEIIPTLGPILAAIPALLIALTVSPQLFITVLIAYVAIQQFESYVIAPRLLGQTVKLNPFVILLSLIIGTKLLGITGALIAVPVTLTAHELFLAYRRSS